MPDTSIVHSPRRQRSFSPASPQSKDAGKSDQNHQQPLNRHNYLQQTPLSPPASISPSNVDASASPSPRFSNLTPLSAPMSAGPSQQSFTQTIPQEDSSLNIDPQSNTQTSFTSQSLVENSQSRAYQVPNRTEKRKLEGNDADETSENGSSKRRRTDHDREGDQESAKSSPINTANILTNSHNPPFYKLLSQTHSISQPHPSQNLFALYGLNDVAASVARNDPVTGEKINKLRKSYEGKVKELPGRNKAVNRPGELLSLIHYPDEEWNIQKVMGKEISADFSDDFLAKLNVATEMGPGKLPAEEDDKWRGNLGLDDTSWKTAAATPTGSQTPALADKPRGLQNPKGLSTAAGEPPRPKRQGTKRRYNDASFEGYGEVYGDDNGDTFSNDGDFDDRGANSGSRRKRRKDSTSFPGATNSVSNYRPNSPQKQQTNTAVSVGSGSYGSR